MGVGTRKPAGLTLIELLVAIAVLSVLASLATTEYAEAATHARVCAIRNDLRVLATALELYCTDNQRYPPATGVGAAARPGAANLTPPASRMVPLTTPISYLLLIPHDQLRIGPLPEATPVRGSFDYLDADSVPPWGSGLTSGAAWRISSAGPDGIQAYGGLTIADAPLNALGVDYDPTNGTRSTGDIVQVGPASSVGGSPDDPRHPYRPGNLRVPRYREQWH